MYLDDFWPLKAQVGYGVLGRHGKLGYEGKRVVVQGKSYQHALSTHAPAHLLFRLDGRFTNFRCQVAINDDVAVGRSHADFIVLADRREVAAAYQVVAGQSPRSLQANISSAQVLELVVRTNRWSWCHTVWLKPQVGQLAIEASANTRGTKHPHTTYLICSTWRTGSTLLCEALTNTSLAGQPEEYFWQGDLQPLWKQRLQTSTTADYLAKLMAHTSTKNGVFGAKMMWAYFDDFIHQAQQMPGYAKLPIPVLMWSVFPNLYYLWITRRDKVRQAVSIWKAIQTNIWKQRTSKALLPAKKPIYNFKKIEYWEQRILQDEAAWQEYFARCNVTPFTVVYEDFVNNYETTAIDILRYLNISVPDDLVFGKRELKKQADALSSEWVERYHQDKKRQ